VVSGTGYFFSICNKIIENAASNRPYDDTFTEFLVNCLTANDVSIRPWIDANDKLPTTKITYYR